MFTELSEAATVGLYWVGFGIALFVIEMATPLFGFVFVGIAAFISAIAAAFGAPFWLQLGVFAVVVLLSFLFVRPKVLAKMYSGEKFISPQERLFGKTGVVTEAVDPTLGQGRILVEGEDWAAESTSSLPSGTSITVKGISGIKLVVEKK